MLILDDHSEKKLEELVKVSEEYNRTLREACAGIPRIIPDRATLLWHALNEEIRRREEKIAKLKGEDVDDEATEEVLQNACSELMKEYEEYNQLMAKLYEEEILPATIPGLLISSVKNATLEMRESNKMLKRIKKGKEEHDVQG